jgi:WD40 repeat protein
MAGDGSTLWLIVGSAVTLVIAAVVAFLLMTKKKQQPAVAPPSAKKDKAPAKKKQQETKKAKPSADSKTSKVVEHSLLLGQLRAHEDEVISMAISASGTTFATLGEDRTVRLYAGKEMTAKDVKPQRMNLEDHGDLLALTNDGSYLLLVLPLAVRSVRLFSLKKGKDGKLQVTKAKDVATKHKSDMKSICVANNNKFFLTCSESDTLVSIFNMNGDELTTVDTKKIKNNMAAISPDSRFFTVGTFTGDVKIYEVATQKGSDSWAFNGVVQAMNLVNGHSSSVNDLSFASDTKRLATCSKDGTWKMWNIDVRYAQKEDPKIIYSVTVGKPVEHIALSPDGSVVVISFEGQLHFYAAADGSLIDSVPRAHYGGERIRSLLWSPDSKFVASSAIKDRAIRLWKNPLKA